MKFPRQILEGFVWKSRVLVTSADVETNVHLLGVIGNAIVVALDIRIQ
jgi:hypothetical protein